jgi:hypothetical protein
MKKALGLHTRYPVIMAVSLLFALYACDDSSSAKESQEESGENASLCKDVPDDVFCDPRDGQLYKTAEFDGISQHCYSRGVGIGPVPEHPGEKIRSIPERIQEHSGKNIREVDRRYFRSIPEKLFQKA